MAKTRSKAEELVENKRFHCSQGGAVAELSKALLLRKIIKIPGSPPGLDNLKTNHFHDNFSTEILSTAHQVAAAVGPAAPCNPEHR